MPGGASLVEPHTIRPPLPERLTPPMLMTFALVMTLLLLGIVCDYIRRHV